MASKQTRLVDCSDASDGETTGVVRDTYHAALQHNNVTPASDALVLGVVRHQMYGIGTHLDRNDERLAPPEDLLREFKDRADARGHNAAFEDFDFERRYREYLRESSDAQAAIADVLDVLASGRDVWLVCYEAEKACHRTILRDVIVDRQPEANPNQT